MKIEKPRHDHKLTDLLKVCIFSLLMLAPLIASCSQWIYATINKNAYQSYSGTQTQFVKQKVENVYRFTNFNNDNEFLYDYYTEFGFNGNVYAIDQGNIVSAYLDEALPDEYNKYENYCIFNYSNHGEGNVLCSLTVYQSIRQTNDLYYTTGICLDYEEFNSFDLTINETFDINIQSLINNGFLVDCPVNYYEMVEVQATTLDNAFYYGVDQMTKSELFNWTQNTALYSGIKAMTDNLQIQTNAIAILLTYWFILTIIYIIVDIVLKLFTTITHLGTKD